MAEGKIKRCMGLALVALSMVSDVSAHGPEHIAKVWIPIVPAPVETDGMRIVAFEILVESGATPPAKVRELNVFDTRNFQPIVRYAGADLVDRAVAAPNHPLRIFVEVNVPRNVRLGTLVAKVVYRARDGSARAAWSSTAAVDRTPTVVLAPPLAEGSWVAVHDPSWPRGHRRVAYTKNGRDSIPGRYAIDWVGVREDGRISVGDPDRPADAVGYGADVLAGSDAVVSAVRDGMRESDSIRANAAQPVRGGSGNYIALRIGASRYAIYEHLRPGSILVRQGQRVRVGQLIGAVGFTGESTGPHLHMHVADCASPLACEGIPFAVSGMTQLGRYAELADLGKRPWTAGPRRRLGAEWPGYNVVVSFRTALPR